MVAADTTSTVYWARVAR